MPVASGAAGFYILHVIPASNQGNKTREIKTELPRQILHRLLNEGE